MHVALNAQLISDQESYRGAGVNNYTRQLLAALGQLVVEEPVRARLTAFVHARTFAAAGVEIVRTRLPLERPLARIVW